MSDKFFISRAFVNLLESNFLFFPRNHIKTDCKDNFFRTLQYKALSIFSKMNVSLLFLTDVSKIQGLD